MAEVGDSLGPDEDYDVLLNILDFPMESLEGDEVAPEWDSSKAEFLGPIPSSLLMEPPLMSNEEFNVPNSSPQPRSHIDAAPELKQLANHVDTCRLRIPQLRKFTKVQESRSFCTQSPVSVLESNGSCSREKCLSIKPEQAIPAQSRSKRVRYSGVNPWLSAAHELSTSKRTSSWKRLTQQPVSIDLMRKSDENVDNLIIFQNLPHEVASKPCDALVKKCSHCQSTKTPLWREGPLGPKTLCNACGVRYRSGCLFPEYRPAASPTFVPSQHSNSYMKVAEMRSAAKLMEVKIKVAPLSSPQTEAKIDEPPKAPQVEAKILELPNSHMKVEEMRTAAKLMEVKTKGAPLSPQTEANFDEAPKAPQLEAKILELPNSHMKVAETRSAAKLMEVKIKIVGTSEQKQPTKHVKQMQLAKHDDTSSSLQIAGAPKRMQLAEHVDTSSSLQIAEVPEKKLLAKDDDTSSSFQIAGAPKRMQLAKHVDTSSSLQIAGAPKRKLLAKHDDTYSSHIPLQNKSTKVQESGAFCTQSRVSLLHDSSYLRYRLKYVEPGGVDPTNSMSGKKSRKVPVAVGDSKNLPQTNDTSLHGSNPAPLQKASNSMRGKKSRKRLLQLPVSVDVMKNSPKNEASSLYISDPAALNPTCPAVVEKCAHCKSTKTPQWREGPLGPKTLCNACGLRYRTGRLLPEYRPAASPTFVPSLNSNSHRKVVRMRIEAMQSKMEISRTVHEDEGRV
ncbi:uncharacterized protein LOC125190610 isoform X2 [Salvia hispanica]|nr:uncharacterized protein LOC125190610 isoform X2 [Salvia hispanica]XP_047943903.1 uncharacterized protein LOC125190610 isoform X2 [Salvia hispanica]XP_047943904.1 uncharacterized protein LOC125190610 isoform X2 [Salvia hispanica]